MRLRSNHAGQTGDVKIYELSGFLFAFLIYGLPFYLNVAPYLALSLIVVGAIFRSKVALAVGVLLAVPIVLSLLYDARAGRDLKDEFKTPKLFRPIERNLPVVVADESGNHCNLVCRRLLASGASPVIVASYRLGRKQDPIYIANRVTRESPCSGSKKTSADFGNGWVCIVSSSGSEPTSPYYEISSDHTPRAAYPAKRAIQAGFPAEKYTQHSSGSYYLVIDKIFEAQREPVLEAFRVVRFRNFAFPLLNRIFIDKDSRVQIIGVPEQLEQILNDNLGFRMKVPKVVSSLTANQKFSIDRRLS